jgi:hypothetical protein
MFKSDILRRKESMMVRSFMVFILYVGDLVGLNVKLLDSFVEGV